ncbi:MAG: alkaline phosphatase family protein [Promethearchaeota archaeon]
MREKLLVFGLDGLSSRMLNRLLEENKIPYIKKISEGGIATTMLSTIPTITGIALPSFMTGINPPKLSQGILTGKNQIKDFSLMKEKAFWEYGVKSCIVNLRCTYKPRPLNGVMISGDLYTPSEDSEYTYPKELKGYVKGFHANLGKFREVGDKNNYLEILKNDTTRKLETFSEIIKKDNYDLSLFWDGNLDLLQHFLWSEKEFIDNYFEFIDGEIKKICKEVRPKNVFLVSDHGFDHSNKYNFNLNTWLEREGYLYLKGNYIRRLISKKINNLLFKIISSNKALSRKAQSYSNVKRNEAPLSKSYPNVDYKLTVAQLATGWWGVEINSSLLNKQDYELIRNKLIDGLLKISHKGEKVVKSAWTSEELYSVTAFNKKQPDIYLLTNPNYKCTPPITSELFSVCKSQSFRPGNHYNSRDGIFLACGEEIESKVSYDCISIIDIAPTILHLFNIPIPKYMDGNVLKEIFEEHSEPAQREIRYTETQNELVKIRNKIKNLKI